MHSLLLSLGILRAPIFVAFLAIVVLSVPDQTHELFEAIGQEEGRSFFGALVRASVFVLLFGLVLLSTSIRLLQTATPYRHEVVLLHRRSLEALTLALPLSMLLGLFIAAVAGEPLLKGLEPLLKGFPTFKALPFGSQFLWQQLLLGAIGIAFLGFLFLFMRFHNLREQIISRVMGLFVFLFRMPTWRSVALFVLAVALLNGAILFYPRAVSYLLGPLGVLFVFFSVSCITLALLGYVYDRFGWPVIGMLVVAALVWAYFPTNDNHHIRLVKKDIPKALPAADAFKKWLELRPDRKDAQFKDRPYPVYIVTAEGGGLYAAAHAAWTLAKIQDNCPAFARHVFAISSVSGGSLGAALFAALVKAHPPEAKLGAKEECQLKRPEHGPTQLAVKRFFEKDFLTPLLAAALFPDFVQRFIPVGIGAFDRARALEDAFERAWMAVAPKDKPHLTQVFSESSRELWSAGQDQPALLLNTTQVQTGARIVISPFKLRELNFLPFIDPQVDVLNSDDVPLLKTAISLSARFPVVTPPGLFYRESGVVVQMVDGGYYENSGIFTALNLIDLLRNAASSERTVAVDGKGGDHGGCFTKNTFSVNLSATETVVVCLKIITIRGKRRAQRFFHSSDFLSLLPTVYNVRFAKGDANLALASDLYCGGEGCGDGTAAADPHIYAKYLDVEGMGLAFGWYLSDKTLDAMFSPFPPMEGDCFKRKSGKGLNWPRNPKAVLEENACLLPRIVRDLTGR